MKNNNYFNIGIIRSTNLKIGKKLYFLNLTQKNFSYLNICIYQKNQKSF